MIAIVDIAAVAAVAAVSSAVVGCEFFLKDEKIQLNLIMKMQYQYVCFLVENKEKILMLSKLMTICQK